MEFTLKLNDKDFPMLKNIKKSKLHELILTIFKSGYQIHFPSEKILEQNETIQRIESIKSEVSNKINSLDENLSKLIGISSNSIKKGTFAENILEDIFKNRYGDIIFERKSQINHSGDAWLHLPNDNTIILESKNYTTTVNKEEIIKLQNDMITNNIKWGIMVSFNSSIQGMKELDFYTFSHSNQTYFIIMISNFSLDIYKLDLALQIIRKLINVLDNNNSNFIIKDINNSLQELNNIVQKNYLLRDTYYNMEREIQKSLSSFYVTLRNYQYDIDTKITEIISKTKIIEKECNILEKYKDKKIVSILSRIIDIAKTKNWIIIENETDYSIHFTNTIIGNIKIQLKKIIINIIENDLTIIFNINKEKENKQNIDILNLL
jgi:hypothetical protein